MRVLIAGCGRLGQAAAAHLLQAGHQVTGLRRSPPDDANSSMQWLAADLTSPDSLAPLASQPSPDVLLYAPTPAARSEEAYHEIFPRGLDHVLAALGSAFTGKLVLVSSTAVYGQDDGSEVDEASPVNPTRFNGRQLLAAEQRAARHPGPVLLARPGGIYGPGREYLLQQLREGTFSVPPVRPAAWTNRIHEHDLARALAQLCQDHSSGPLNLVDCKPVPRHELMRWLAGELGVEWPQPAETGPEPAGADSGKRVLNHRLLASGFRFTYPDYQAGYRAILEGNKGQET